MISQVLGTRIRELRKFNNMTLDQLGEIVGLKKASLSQVENGKVHVGLEVVYNAANYFNVSVDYLLGRTDNPEINK